MSNFLPFALPDIGEEEINEVVDALRSGWVTTGPKTKQFESDFKDYLGGNVEALAVNSATSGLHLALEAVGVKAGDEVLVPTLTFTATAEVVRYLGAHPVFVDCDPNTLNIDINKIEEKITDKTKAVVPVHFAGLACDMDRIIALAKKYNLKVVEDAAHAFPTLYKGKLIGTLDSDATVFSFYANKTMTTGEGGMVVSRDKTLIDRMKVMRLHGISRDAFERYQSKTPAWYYEVIEPGFKYNLPDICAALGLQQLKKIDRFYQKRLEMANKYEEVLSSLPIILPPKALGNNTHAWHIYPIRLKADCGISRDEFIIKMSEKGIGCSVHFIPLHKQPIWRDSYHLKPEDFPIAEQVYQNILSIPLFTKMTDEDQNRVINAMKEIFAEL
ncbi:UDP-4-amino-4,6-dideoxy-N-acetyl-beta-L-altrosamine transaminase [Canicola haemoglobinophilus]|uniref:DegT/DnrJ/EryC1/StrS aminotransferase n=1 Tax=Canicola haemoglobinophilus TaxID=733 RepID=A0A1V4AZF6_9PAST|nr:DegT/DnrJ/EryC1/StrS family aminotransferase [Canicola haemoglobinophilus]OOR98515.1 UDP-4-amino-4,6-dideoxy-N-acetyl-beta-L-altrosamine transaminase [Canicola haemoglobinophilus]STO60064.1 DegT/DnrJ/EryC1/StrS aminotransferase [Canicola haemoglobinophilus]